MITLNHLPEFFANHTAFMPVIGLACSGFAVALLQTPGRISDAESIMNFSSLGTLRCICGAEHMDNDKRPPPSRPTAMEQPQVH
jgi:hypothetical protein